MDSIKNSKTESNVPLLTASPDSQIAAAANALRAQNAQNAAQKEPPPQTATTEKTTVTPVLAAPSKAKGAAAASTGTKRDQKKVRRVKGKELEALKKDIELVPPFINTFISCRRFKI